MNFTIYTANVVGSETNCEFPNKKCISSKEDMFGALNSDYVVCQYKNNYRSVANFISSDCICLDCDNTHSDDEHDWVTTDDIKNTFPGVSFAVHFSRNHLKPKGKLSARPRFHVFFPIKELSDATKYKDLKLQICEEFDFFDTNAIDVGRLFFGTEEPQVEWCEGELLIDEFLAKEDDFEKLTNNHDRISEGSRNATMSHIAGRIVKRFGDSEESFEMFMEQAKRCDPPLPQWELTKIWQSAQRFGEKIRQQEGYIPPEEYGKSPYNFRPTDFSDKCQASILAEQYKDVLKYTEATDFMVFNGCYWEESNLKAQELSQKLTDLQLQEAIEEKERLTEELARNGVLQLIAANGKKAKQFMTASQKVVFGQYEDALAYEKYVTKRRDSKYIQATMKEVRPMVAMRQKDFDVGEFWLNTPEGTYDLRTGDCKPHDSLDFITKSTEVSPSDVGQKLWMEAVYTFFEGDCELVEYVQRVVGLAVIGKVYFEALIIAYGDGRNGKSTFWNTIARVLGTYSGNISADILTVGCKRNVKPELAEAKGKRLLIAAELEEGMRLNTSNVKQLCSTDEIYAEKKYKAPFSYEPTHTLVLYTNHLPKVGAIDKGTWRRLIVIPFNATIDGSSDIKNYADYLFYNAGGAILAWIMEGAKKIIQEEFKLVLPSSVDSAINEYKSNNDWLSYFLEERCVVGDEYSVKSGEFYTQYRQFCIQIGEFARSNTEFYGALDTRGFIKKRTKDGVIIKGVGFKSDFLE